MRPSITSGGRWINIPLKGRQPRAAGQRHRFLPLTYREPAPHAREKHRWPSRRDCWPPFRERAIGQPHVGEENAIVFRLHGRKYPTITSKAALRLRHFFRGADARSPCAAATTRIRRQGVVFLLAQGLARLTGGRARSNQRPASPSSAGPDRCQADRGIPDAPRDRTGVTLPGVSAARSQRVGAAPWDRRGR